MKATELNIGGRAVQRITLGDAVVYEGKPKRYAYRFNGISSGCTMSEIVIANEGDSISLKAVYGNTWNWRGVLYKSMGTSVYYKDSAELHDAGTGEDYGGVYPLVDHTFTIAKEGGRIVLKTGNTVKATTLQTVSYNEIAAATMGATRWGGIIYGFALNGGEMQDLSELPGVRFRNVTRYELDENGEVIESSATTLNS